MNVEAVPNRPRKPIAHSERWHLRPMIRVSAAMLVALASVVVCVGGSIPLIDPMISGLEYVGLAPAPLPPNTYGGNLWAGRTYAGREPPHFVVGCMLCLAIVALLVPFLLALRTHDRLTWRKLIADSRPRCAKCDYLLIELEQPRCPECGTAFSRESGGDL